MDLSRPFCLLSKMEEPETINIKESKEYKIVSTEDDFTIKIECSDKCIYIK